MDFGKHPRTTYDSVALKTDRHYAGLTPRRIGIIKNTRTRRIVIKLLLIEDGSALRSFVCTVRYPRMTHHTVQLKTDRHYVRLTPKTDQHFKEIAIIRLISIRIFLCSQRRRIGIISRLINTEDGSALKLILLKTDRHIGSALLRRHDGFGSRHGERRMDWSSSSAAKRVKRTERLVVSDLLLRRIALIPASPKASSPSIPGTVGRADDPA